MISTYGITYNFVNRSYSETRQSLARLKNAQSAGKKMIEYAKITLARNAGQNEEIIELSLKLLNDPYPKLRISAASFLKTCRSPQIKEVLFSAFEKEINPSVQRAILKALKA